MIMMNNSFLIYQLYINRFNYFWELTKKRKKKKTKKKKTQKGNVCNNLNDF